MKFAEACVKAQETKEDYTNGGVTIRGIKAVQGNIFEIGENEYCNLGIYLITEHCQGEFHEVVDWKKVEFGEAVMARNSNYVWLMGTFISFSDDNSNPFWVLLNGDDRPYNFHCCRLAEEE